jgi:hypothetical protein
MSTPDTDAGVAQGLLRSARSGIGRHPLVGRLAVVEVALVSTAVVVAILGTETQTYGLGLLNLLSGLLVVTAMIVAVLAVVGAVGLLVVRGLSLARRRVSVPG